MDHNDDNHDNDDLLNCDDDDFDDDINDDDDDDCHNCQGYACYCDDSCQKYGDCCPGQQVMILMVVTELGVVKMMMLFGMVTIKTAARDNR